MNFSSAKKIEMNRIFLYILLGILVLLLVLVLFLGLFILDADKNQTQDSAGKIEWLEKNK